MDILKVNANSVGFNGINFTQYVVGYEKRDHFTQIPKFGFKVLITHSGTISATGLSFKTIILASSWYTC